MRDSFVLESMEARSLLSAAVKMVAIPTVGASGGNSPSIAPPMFLAVHGSVHDSNGNLEPDESANGIDLDSGIKLQFDPSAHGSIDATHLLRAAIQITDTDRNQVLVSSGPNADLAKVITSGGGDTIVVTLKHRLQPNTHYTIEVNGAYTPTSNPDDRIRTVDGADFADVTFTFTTGTFYAHPTPGFTSAFATAVTQTAAGSHGFTCVTMGPDGDLYASDTEGFIYQYTIAGDGTLSLQNTISTVRAMNGGARLITGIAFSPVAKASDPLVMYVSHSQYRFGNSPNGSDDVEKYADNFTGKISTVYGTNFGSYQDLIVNIPRSVKDHTNNQIVFAPNGKNLFFGIAAMNAMGKADTTWGGRVENIYSATIMVLRLGSAPNGLNTYYHATGGPVNLMIDGPQNTADGLTPGTLHYNIFKGTNPLRIYADGIRNDYDMVWATNGHLYAGINGSSSGGNVPMTPTDTSTVPIANRPDKDAQDSRGNYIYHVDPKDVHSAYKAYTGPTSPTLTNVPIVEEDSLLDVQITKYYGHPNASRGEYILDGGNPTSGTDPYEFAQTNGSQAGSLYPVGQQPDRNYTLPIYDMGQDNSPDGMFQYKSVNGLDKDLDGYLLVARYSSGGDILALKPNASSGKIDQVEAGISGLTDLGTPLDLTEDTSTGNLYVAVLTDETGAGTIQLLKPSTTSSSTVSASVSPSKLGFYVTPGGHSAQKGVTITNTGTAPLVFDATTSKIGGSGRKNFGFVNFPGGQTSIAVGSSLTLQINGRLNKGQTDTAIATLYLATNDPDSPFLSVPLRAFVLA